MSEPSDDLLKALADLMYQGQDSQAQTGGNAAPGEPPVADEPEPEDFLARLAACERAANA